MIKCRLRKNFRFALILFFLVLMACAPTKTTFYKQPDGKVAKYDVVEIPNFNKIDTEWVPYDSYTQIPDMLAEKLRTTDGFKEIRRSESGAASGGRVLLVKGTVIDYNRGCKYCEWLIRANDKGKSSVSVWVRLIDKNTGNVITDASIDGRAKEPGYGRSRYIRVVDEIAHLIEGVNGEKS